MPTVRPPLHLRVATAPPLAGSPRLAYVLDTLTEWAGWTWAWEQARPGEPGAGPHGVREKVVRLDYRAEPGRPAPREVRTVFLSAEGSLAAGATLGEAAWGDYAGVPCPRGADPLAGAFELLALAAEYRDLPRDLHKRLPADAYPHAARGHAGTPLADRLLGALARRLLEAAGEPTPADGAPFRQQPTRSTLDVDDARYALGRGPRRWLGHAYRSLAHADLAHIRHALASLAPGARDPYDTFGLLGQLHRARELRAQLFVLPGYGTRLDPNLPLLSPTLRAVVAEAAAWADIHLHPSYRAADDPGLLRRELDSWRDFAGASPEAVRMHFLRARIPTTYRILEALGVRHDYSAAWADRTGFRCGTARAFRWYDLQAERSTQLRLHPPHAMDVTLRNYMRLSPREACEELAALAGEAARSRSGLHLIWHNTNLGPAQGWSAWREVYACALDLLAG